ncbi:MAG TPA: BTAD domain-containing putative transcriptional regulator, partial [Gemmatimonadales bacterium]
MTDPKVTDPTPVAVKLFGGVMIHRGGEPVGGAAAHRHRLALVAVLATSGGPVSRDKLTALLWPERDDESGRNLLKVALHGLRKILGEEAIRTIGDQLAIDPVALPCDVMEFDTAVKGGALEQAVRGYGGLLMDGFHLRESPDFEHFLDAERTRLAQGYAGALERLAADADERKDVTAATQWWRLLAGHDPLRADVAMRLMRALALSGDTAGALRHADVYARLTRDTMDMEPDPAVMQLAADLRAAPPGLLVPPGVKPVAAAVPGRRVTPTPVAAVSRHRGRLVAAAIAAVVILAIAATALYRWRARTAADSADPAAREGGAIVFAGTGGATTPAGSVVTTKVDNIAVDLMVRYDGPTPGVREQVIFYNGNTAFSGWGLMVSRGDSAVIDGTLTLLAGGVVIVKTPLVLRRGVWQHLTVERRDWKLTLKLDDLSWNAGTVLVHPVGAEHGAVERTLL